ncbi:aminoglycoside phosphotransferase family protein [Sphingomonas sp. PAMC26645]|uniref:phosphotransferase enzyme family protein n=1 Tax=Sphingomonas sp. PAMC26645 TaxID=2565555 RepID=UPI00109DD518|nr:phosphotransferase [Sphingomonas sp. PAMC26645]QCB43757.1 aminoglycoside phosphotransferase family protein [Sphingomonas sp. PAMC26645]
MASQLKHLVHGMGTTLEAPTWPAIAADEAQAALAHFPGTGRMTGLHWHSPRPFSAATLVHTTNGAFLLKRHHHRVRTVEGLAEEHAFIAHLAGAGVSVPEVMATAQGASAVAIGPWSYELHRQAPGEDLYRDRLSWTPFLSLDYAHAAGVALAELHVAARGFDAPVRRRQPLVSSFTILPAADPLIAARAYVASRPALAAFLADRPWQAQLARLFEQADSDLSSLLVKQASLWTHNDWHPSNLLWTREGAVRTVFDFGLADRTNAVHDIATAIERTAVRWLDLGQGADDAIADPETALALMAGYAEVLPLSDEEIAAIVSLLPLVHVEFALSEADYFTAVVADTASAAMAWDGYLIDHAAWFFSPLGQEFLRRIAQS